MKRTPVSVVCPCHNEEGNVARLVNAVAEAFERRDQAWELVLVNDGSKDATWSAISQASAADPRVVGINLSRNFGKESAMFAGLSHARGDVVVLMDADLQHPVELVPSMIDLLQEEGVEQVVARRTREGDGWLRSTLSRMYYRHMGRFMDVELRDGVGDFRALSRRAVDSLLSLGESNRFSKGLFEWIGFETRTIDYRNVARDAGASSWSLGSLFRYGMDGFVSFSDAPLRLSFHLGLTALALGVGYLLWLFASWVLHGVVAPGYLTTVGAVIVFAGVQMMMLGVLGEYVGRIYREVKGRPIYLTAQQVGTGLSASVSDPADSAPAIRADLTSKCP